MRNFALASAVFVLTAGVLVLQLINLLAGEGSLSSLKSLFWLSVNVDPVTKQGHTHYSLVGACCWSMDGLTHFCQNNVGFYSINPNSDSFWGYAGVKLAAPSWFLKHASYVHWVTRLLFPLYVVSLALNLLAMVCILPGLRFRAARITALACACTALVFEASASGMASAVFHKSRNAFRANGYQADVGTKLLALTWTAVSMLALSVGLLIVHTHQIDNDTVYPASESESGHKYMSRIFY